MIISSMFLLFTAAPNPVLPNAAQHKVDTSDNPGSVSSLPLNALSEHQGLTLKKAFYLARQKGLSVSDAKKEAIKTHDPTLNDFYIVEKWHKMKDSPSKNELLKLMEENQFLKPFLGLGFNNNYFNWAIINGELDKVKYFMARGYLHSDYYCIIALIYKRMEIIEYLIKKDPTGKRSLIVAAIDPRNPNPELITLLAEKGGIFPTQEDLLSAKEQIPQNFELIKALEKALFHVKLNDVSAIQNTPHQGLTFRKTHAQG